MILIHKRRLFDSQKNKQAIHPVRAYLIIAFAPTDIPETIAFPKYISGRPFDA